MASFGVAFNTDRNAGVLWVPYDILSIELSAQPDMPAFESTIQSTE